MNYCKYFILFLSIFCFELQGQSVFGKGKYQTSDLKSLVETISFEDTTALLRDFIKNGSPSRFSGSMGHRLARQFIIDYIKKGQRDSNELLTVEDFEPGVAEASKLLQDDFDLLVKGKIPETDPEYRRWENYTRSSIKLIQSFAGSKGMNIVWEKKGSLPTQGIMVIANYDTLVYDSETMLARSNSPMPGADHNGSGVIAALQIIHLLQQIPLARTVRVVFLDMETLGFLGSHHLAKSFDKTRFSSAINLLALGHDGVSTDKLKKEGNRVFYGRESSAADKQLAGHYTRAGDHVNVDIQSTYLANSFRQGSTFNFWEKGINALVFTHDWENDSNEQRMFSPNDFVETLNLKSLVNSIKYISAGILAESLDLKL